MATAPSADGILEFHVRALSNGWVSGPLVWRAQVGDQLRLGAPMGDMRIDQQSRRDVLMVAGGTGLAPVKALVDGMSRWNTSRHVTLFFGARRASDLYDMGPLHRLAAMNPWLTVVPVVSDDRTFSGEQGLLPDAVAARGSWGDHDVFVSGSPAMTRSTVNRLMQLGVPADRLRFDVGDTAYGEHPATAQVIDLRRTRANRAVGGR
jgi:NAD(P)H-flavin reductase